MNTIQFGSYWQTDSEHKEPIEWLVLKEEGDKMYVLSKYCLDCVPYKDGRKVAWKNSFMRKWLNTEFLGNAFSVEEQARILLSEVKTYKWGRSQLDSGDTVQDKVFVPSVDEADLYFSSTGYNNLEAEEKRITRPTPYAYERGCFAYPLFYDTRKPHSSYLESIGKSADEFDLYWHREMGRIHRFQFGDVLECDTAKTRWGCEWYLRAPMRWIVKVYADGAMGDVDQNAVGVAVRPAMWIKK